MTIREILRDAPAGQLARTYLGWNIAPYEDEREGFKLPQAEEKPNAPPADVSHDAHHDSTSDDASDKEKDKDLESNAPNGEAGGHVPHAGNDGGRDVERIATEQEQHANTMQHTTTEVGFSQNDPDDPKNWSTLRKVFIFGQICLLTFTSKFGNGGICVCETY